MIVRLSVLSIFLLGSAACHSRPDLTSTRESAEGVAAAVLDALARQDRPALERLALNEDEFSEHVWPYLPAARPERNLPLAYVWSDLRQKSQAGLTQTLARHGGRKYQLIGVVFDDRTDYGAYRVHREARVNVRDASGTLTTIRVCGSMIEKDADWKVFSYVVDE